MSSEERQHVSSPCYYIYTRALSWKPNAGQFLPANSFSWSVSLGFLSLGFVQIVIDWPEYFPFGAISLRVFFTSAGPCEWMEPRSENVVSCGLSHIFNWPPSTLFWPTTNKQEDRKTVGCGAIVSCDRGALWGKEVDRESEWGKRSVK